MGIFSNPLYMGLQHVLHLLFTFLQLVLYIDLKLNSFIKSGRKSEQGRVDKSCSPFRTLFFKQRASYFVHDFASGFYYICPPSNLARIPLYKCANFLPVKVNKACPHYVLDFYNAFRIKNLLKPPPENRELGIKK